jgi:Fic family protein
LESFLKGAGGIFAIIKYIAEEDRENFIVEILSSEGWNTSKIEGEVLQRESLQSSIQRNLNLKANYKKDQPMEKGVADLMCHVYKEYESELTHETLYYWHSLLFQSGANLDCVGKYRSHTDPMQIVSNKYGDSKVFFEAPPSSKIYDEMEHFIYWFNHSKDDYSPLARASIVHLYFENIHPFEDGNGRIGRALVEKALSQSLGNPTLITISKIIEENKREYYEALGECNSNLDASSWVTFFSNLIIESQKYSIEALEFLVSKSKLMHSLDGKINPRQEKTLIRIFDAGLEGFKGGLSAENYITITKASRATATRDLFRYC